MRSSDWLADLRKIVAHRNGGGREASDKMVFDVLTGVVCEHMASAPHAGHHFQQFLSHINKAAYSGSVDVSTRIVERCLAYMSLQVVEQNGIAYIELDPPLDAVLPVEAEYRRAFESPGR